MTQKTNPSPAPPQMSSRRPQETKRQRQWRAMQPPPKVFPQPEPAAPVFKPLD